MTECMVALLRGQSYASPSDVEMYFKNYQGLMYKISKIDPATVPKEAVETNAKELDRLADNFTDEKGGDFALNSEFIHMYAWAQNFCKLCTFGRVVKEIEDKLEAGKKRIVWIAVYKQRAKSCLEDLEIFDIEALREERNILKNHIEKCENEKEMRSLQLKTLQDNYLEFEVSFFAELNQYKRNSMVSSKVGKM